MIYPSFYSWSHSAMSLSSIRITIGTVKSIDFVRGLSIQGSVVVQSALNYKARHNAVSLFELTLRTQRYKNKIQARASQLFNLKGPVK